MTKEEYEKIRSFLNKEEERVTNAIIKEICKLEGYKHIANKDFDFPERRVHDYINRLNNINILHEIISEAYRRGKESDLCYY